MGNMLKNWRAWVLLVLLVGPVLAYIGFGMLWLFSHGGLVIAGSLWIASGIVFAILASRWTHSQRELLPPIDWDSPRTFSQFDRDAWKIVADEAERGESFDMTALTGADVYIDTGRQLARKLAHHYHPFSTDPFENVPFVDLLTALELAAEDLDHLCRQVPGGDLITTGHWKKAVQVAGYLQRANDIYSFLLPIFSPVSGVVRLGAQQLMVKPAWKNMQQNMLRWFFRAFVNRLGTHLIELYSGRLTIGAEHYRKLTRKTSPAASVAVEEPVLLTVAVAGARDAGKSRLIEAIAQSWTGDPTLVKARLGASGIDEAALEKLKSAHWVEVPGYTASLSGETARDRATRRAAVELAVDADFLILVSDGRRDTHAADSAFAQAWDHWYVDHPSLDIPPALLVITAVDSPEFGGDWSPPYQWSRGIGTREVAVRARMDALRAALPPTMTEIVAVGLPEVSPFGTIEHLLPAVAAQLPRAERAALIRHLHQASTRSKARRLVSQVGGHGRWLWKNLVASGRRAPAGSSERPAS